MGYHVDNQIKPEHRNFVRDGHFQFDLTRTPCVRIRPMQRIHFDEWLCWLTKVSQYMFLPTGKRRLSLHVYVIPWLEVDSATANDWQAREVQVTQRNGTSIQRRPSVNRRAIASQNRKSIRRQSGVDRHARWKSEREVDTATTEGRLAHEVKVGERDRAEKNQVVLETTIQYIIDLQVKVYRIFA